MDRLEKKWYCLRKKVEKRDFLYGKRFVLGLLDKEKWRMVYFDFIEQPLHFADY